MYLEECGKTPSIHVYWVGCGLLHTLTSAKLALLRKYKLAARL